MAPPVVYINLTRASERRAFMERQGAAQGIALERVAARDAASVDDATMRRLSRRWERPLTRIEVAVFLSHSALWRRAADSASGLVILEDDAVLSSRFRDALDCLDAVADRADLVNLECFERRKFVRREPVVRWETHRLTEVVRDKAGAAGYFVTASGARKLAELAEDRAAPADAFLFSVVELVCAQIEPAPVMQVQHLARRGIDPGFATPTSIQMPRDSVGWGPGTWPFKARRLMTDLALAPLHLRRLVDLDFRVPTVSLDDYRAATRSLAAAQTDS